MLARVHQLVRDLSRPLASKLGLTELPEHAPLLLASALTFWSIQVLVSPMLSKTFFPSSYGRLKSNRGRNNWHIHVVSLVHALIIIPFSLRCLDLEQLSDDRAFGWDPRAGSLIAVACGYFLWDTIESVVHFTDVGFVVHGLACFLIYLLSFKPFIAYYGPQFLLWELSTPFLNIHWFLDKMGLTGSTFQLVNGVVLLTAFAGVRLVYGAIQSYAFYCTLYSIRDSEVPIGVLLVYGIGNVVLTSLNWFWFVKMIAALRKRMGGPKPKENGKAKRP